MAILDKIDALPAADKGTVAKSAQRLRKQSAQAVVNLEVMLTQMKRLVDTHGLAALQVELDGHQDGDGADLVAFHAAMVSAVKTVKPLSKVPDLE